MYGIMDRPVSVKSLFVATAVHFACQMEGVGVELSPLASQLTPGPTEYDPRHRGSRLYNTDTLFFGVA